MGEFKQAVIVITGAAGNLGRAVAQCFAAERAHLALLDRDTTGIGETISVCQGQGAAQAFATDLIDPGSVEKTINEVLAAFGKIDVLANIAGGFSMGPLVQDTGDEVWDFS